MQQYLDALQQLTSCITNEVPNNVGGYHPSDRPHLVTLARGTPVRLRAPQLLRLSIREWYSVQQAAPQSGWIVTTVGYMYDIFIEDDQPALSYHWHPIAPRTVTFPHVHLEAGAQIGLDVLHRAHLPTGIVSVRDIVRLVIEELGVEPRRSDWRSVLEMPSLR